MQKKQNRENKKSKGEKNYGGKNKKPDAKQTLGDTIGTQQEEIWWRFTRQKHKEYSLHAFNNNNKCF